MFIKPLVTFIKFDTLYGYFLVIMSSLVWKIVHLKRINALFINIASPSESNKLYPHLFQLLREMATAS